MFRYTLYQKRKGFLSSMSITNKLILINILFYFISLILLGFYGEKFFLENIAITPSLIISGENLWTFFTSVFSHIQFFHIFANMFSLFFIGNFLEKIIGRKRFILIYLVSGLVGGIFFVASGTIFNNPSSGIGASGAIFGILGVLAILVPYSKIYLIVGPLILILLGVIIGPLIPENMLSFFNLIVNMLIIAMIFSIFSFNQSIRKFAIPLELRMWLLPIVAIVPLIIIGFFVDLPIGNSAHIGGLILGTFYGFYLKNQFPKKTRMIRSHFK